MNIRSKNMWPIYVAILAGLIAVVGAYYQVKEKEESDKEAKQAKDDAVEWNRKFENSQNNLIIEAQKTASASADLAEANKKIIELQDQINVKTSHIIESNEKLIASQGEALKNLLGVGYIKITPALDMKNNQLQFLVKNESDYPLYDVDIYKYNYNEIMKLKLIKYNGDYVFKKSEFEAHMQQHPPKFDVPANMSLELAFKEPLGTDERYFFFKTSYKHQMTGQYLILKFNPVTKKINYSYKIFKIDLRTKEFTLLEEQGHTANEIWGEKFYFKKLYNLLSE